MTTPRDSSKRLPKTPAFSFEVPLYPKSAEFLLSLLENPKVDLAMQELPQYALIDVSNFRNQLAAHLQKVVLGS